MTQTASTWPTASIEYHQEFWSGVMETVDQEIEVLGSASAGTMNIVANRHIGDFSKYSFIQQIDLTDHRDTDSTGAATALKPLQAEVVRAKTNRIIGPIDMTIDFWKKIGSDVGEMFFLMGNEIGRQMVRDYVNTIIRCGVANALDNAANVVNDISAGTGGAELMQFSALNGANALFGDRSGSIAAYVMHSKVWHDLVGDSIANQGSLDTVGGVTINTGGVASLGRPVIVTDSPALDLGGSPNDFITLGLVRGALTVMESEERTMVNQVVTGLDNLVQRIQGEYAFTNDVKGYTWLASTRNPDDTALDLGTNWSQSASSLKDTALVAVRSQ